MAKFTFSDQDSFVLMIEGIVHKATQSKVTKIVVLMLALDSIWLAAAMSQQKQISELKAELSLHEQLVVMNENMVNFGNSLKQLKDKIDGTVTINSGSMQVDNLRSSDATDPDENEESYSHE